MEFRILIYGKISIFEQKQQGMVCSAWKNFDKDSSSIEFFEEWLFDELRLLIKLDKMIMKKMIHTARLLGAKLFKKQGFGIETIDNVAPISKLIVLP